MFELIRYDRVAEHLVEKETVAADANLVDGLERVIIFLFLR